MAGCSPRRRRSATRLIRRNTNSSKEGTITKPLRKGRQGRLTTSLQRYRESMVATLLKYSLKRRNKLTMEGSIMQRCPSAVNTNSSKIATNKPARPSTAYGRHQISARFARKSHLFSIGQRKFTGWVSKGQPRRKKSNHLMSSVLREIRTRRWCESSLRTRSKRQEKMHIDRWWRNTQGKTHPSLLLF